MQINTGPEGKYASLLVGHQWPTSNSQMTLGSSSTRRAETKAAFEAFSELLSSKLNAPIASQEGTTAEDIRLAFEKGKDHAFELAEKNETKAQSYSTAHQSVATLREQLNEIARTGSDAIESAMTSKRPTSVKITEITDIVVTA